MCAGGPGQTLRSPASARGQTPATWPRLQHPALLTFWRFQAFGAGWLEPAQGPLNHLLVLAFHCFGRVRFIILRASREDFACSAAGYLWAGKKTDDGLSHCCPLEYLRLEMSDTKPETLCKLSM